MSWILWPHSDPASFAQQGGGKAANMQRLQTGGFVVPPWFCVSSAAFDAFVAAHDFDLKVDAHTPLTALAARLEAEFAAAPLPPEVRAAVVEALQVADFGSVPVAVRSSGLDEDSADNSFAGQFASYLFQRGIEAVERSLKLCWASGYSERALAYRQSRGLACDHIGVGVVVQRMIDAEVAGVAFSRNPVRPLDRKSVIVESVYGLGEGLVSGVLEADHYEVQRDTQAFTVALAPKPHALRRAEPGGLQQEPVPAAKQAVSSLSDAQILAVADLAVRLEEVMGSPQDCEWAYEDDALYCLQTRPITSLPPPAFFDAASNGASATLWDNSNIIESYSGVTSPLTFSFASRAYEQVYIQFCEIMGVPQPLIAAHAAMFRNMLGMLRGRIYYNLINWYRLVVMLPGSSSFMETMMGVRQSLKPEHHTLFDFANQPPRYSLAAKVRLGAKTMYRFLRIESIVSRFQHHFEATYQEARNHDFAAKPLPDLLRIYQHLDEQLLRRWHAPIINDYLCMVFYGLLKKLTERWLRVDGDAAVSLQNDLLCGQGDLESVEPTKMLMRIAADADTDAKLRAWLLGSSADAVLRGLNAGQFPVLKAQLDRFLDLYGFRCVNELKLEEPDLYDNPSFAVNAIQSYVRMRSYDTRAMAERESAIRDAAEAKAHAHLSLGRRVAYFWVLKHARRAVRNRENLRFARTKIFGIVRHLFRAVGQNLTQMHLLDASRDIFYLTVEEIFAFVEGRALGTNLRALVSMRQHEFNDYRGTQDPPARLVTYGAVAASVRFPQVLDDGDLLRAEQPVSTDPNTLVGTPCCPGIIEGVVRVAKDLKDAENLDGEILVTGRTDPGWVPLYPACSALLIERGSLLSHSAVVARELGLPTVVGISGGLMTRLKTGMQVRVDAGKGEVTILS